MKASDVVDVVASQEMQEFLVQKRVFKPSISEHTAQCWLTRLGWRYGKLKNGMYIDGHERDNVVEYRHGFVSHWKEYEHCFHKWDNDGIKLPQPDGFLVPGGCFRLIPVTHDELTFYQNDQRNMK